MHTFMYHIQSTKFRTLASLAQPVHKPYFYTEHTCMSFRASLKCSIIPRTFIGWRTKATSAASASSRFPRLSSSRSIFSCTLTSASTCAGSATRRSNNCLTCNSTSAFIPVRFVQTGLTHKRLMQTGFTHRRFMQTGFTHKRLMQTGFTHRRFMQTGFTHKRLMQTGFTHRRFMQTGFTHRRFMQTGFTYRRFMQTEFTHKRLMQRFILEIKTVDIYVCYPLRNVFEEKQFFSL